VSVDDLVRFFRGAEPTPAWFADANCLGLDPAVFITERGESLEPARRICGGCQVRVECPDYALTRSPRVVGVWGGTTDRERRNMRRGTREDTA